MNKKCIKKNKLTKDKFLFNKESYLKLIEDTMFI